MGLLIRVPPLSYAVLGGAISPRVLCLVQLRLVSENWTGALEWPKLLFSLIYDSFLESGYSLFRHPAWGSKVTCIFNKIHLNAGF